MLQFYPPFGKKPSGKRLESFSELANFSEGRFKNLEPIKEDFTWDDYKRMIPMMLKGNPRGIPKEPLPMIKWKEAQLSELEKQDQLVWFGHSSFYLRMNGMNILIDPMFGDYPSPLPYLVAKRFNTTFPIDIEELPQIDLILLSHDHYDHLDYGTIKKLMGKTRQFIVPLGVGSHLESWGVDPDLIQELYWGEETNLGDIKFSCTPAQHFSGRGVGDRQCTLWAGWVIDGAFKIFFSGDSGYFSGFKDIGEQYGPFDYCLMECGQYNLLWKDIHMMPEETAQASLDVKGRRVIPIHWGAFRLAVHDWDDSIDRVAKALEGKDIQLVTPILGQPIVLGEETITRDWWRGLE